MGELCPRWAMKLSADAPIVWPDNATFSKHQIRDALLSLDDTRDLPRLSVAFLADRTGLAQSRCGRVCAGRAVRRSSGHKGSKMATGIAPRLARSAE